MTNHKTIIFPPQISNFESFVQNQGRWGDLRVCDTAATDDKINYSYSCVTTPGKQRKNLAFTSLNCNFVVQSWDSI
jgi:hypothetical protein